MWTYQGEKVTTIESLPNSEDLFGFIYRITNMKTGQIYIGKKQFYSKRKKSLAKKDLSTDKRKKTYTHVVKESDWLTYWSSSDRLKTDMKELGESYFKREILQLSCSLKYLTWLEIEYQIKNNVLYTDSYNDNIMSRYFRKDMDPKCP